MIEGILYYDLASDRWMIVDEYAEVQHPGLHCGECFAVLLPGGWTDTRIEYGNGRPGWYLVGVADYVPDGLSVRYGR